MGATAGIDGAAKAGVCGGALRGFALAGIGGVLDRSSLMRGGSREIVPLVYCLDGAVEATEERFGAGEDRKEIHCVGEFVDF